MTQLRQRAKAVKTTGAAKRRDWNPSASSGHYKVYKWWQRKSGKHISVENFCHYWRVVFIWAPLRWLQKPLIALLCLVAAAGIIIAAVREFKAFFGALIALAVILYLIFGVRVTGQMLKEVNEDEFDNLKWRWLDRKSNTVKAAMCFLAMGVEIVAAILAVTLLPPVIFFVSLGTDYDVYRRFGKWLVQTHFSDRKALTWIRPVLAYPVALVVLSIWYQWARAFLIVLLCWATLAAAVVLVAYLADRSKEKKQEAIEQARMEVEAAERKYMSTFLLPRLFAILHPKWASDENRYHQWLSRYQAYCEQMWGYDADQMNAYLHFRYASRRYLLKYGSSIESVLYRQLETYRRVEEDKPSRLRVAASNIGDFFVLLWSVVLVKKWKICPIVQLPE